MRIPDWSPARKAQPKALVHAESQSFANSEATVMALIEALRSAVAYAAQGSVKAAAQLADAVLSWLHGSSPSRLRTAGDAARQSFRKQEESSKLSKAKP